MKTPKRAAVRMTSRHLQAGLTLVELMVAVVLGMLVAAAAVAALIIARSGFTSVDNSSQLRENARFAASIIQRVGVQAGFENAAGGNFTYWRAPCTTPGGPACGDSAGDTNPGIRGYDDAYVSDHATLPGGLAHGDRTTKCATADTSCNSGSDVLLVRYWGDARDLGAVTGDGSMINCAGMPVPEGAVPAYSVFHIRRSSAGEPTLVCSYRDPTTGVWDTVPLVQGVESMQILYGVDNVTENTAPPTVFDPAAEDSVAERYMRASLVDVPGNAAATADNWRRVRSVRIGLLIRGAAGSAVDRAARDYPVLGDDYAVTADTRATLPAPADGRLRHSVVFTVHMRNPQYYVSPAP